MIARNFKVSTAMIKLAEKNGWADPFTEVDAFRDYHLAKGSLMFDWEAAFRTWMRNQKKWQDEKQQSERPARAQPSRKVELPEISDEERKRNITRVRELFAKIGKPIK